MKSHKHDRTARLPFPAPVEAVQPEPGEVRPRCVRLRCVRRPAPRRRRTGGEAAVAHAAVAGAPLALHRLDLHDLHNQRAAMPRATRAQSVPREHRLPVFSSEARRGPCRVSSSPRLAPRTDRGPSLTVATPSARAVRQSEACAFYLDLVGAVTAMTLVVLAAILV